MPALAQRGVAARLGLQPPCQQRLRTCSAAQHRPLGPPALRSLPPAQAVGTYIRPDISLFSPSKASGHADLNWIKGYIFVCSTACRASVVDLSPAPTNSILCMHAQVNLFLRITRRREDGYHDLASLFHVRRRHIKPPLAQPLSLNTFFFVVLLRPCVSVVLMSRHLHPLTQVIDFGDKLEVSRSASPIHDTLTCAAPGASRSPLQEQLPPASRVPSSRVALCAGE